MINKDQQRQSNNAKIRLLKDAYKKVKRDNTKTGVTSMSCPFYNDIDEFLVTPDIIKLPGVGEVGVNEDNHINLSG